MVIGSPYQLWFMHPMHTALGNLIANYHLNCEVYNGGRDDMRDMPTLYYKPTHIELLLQLTMQYKYILKNRSRAFITCRIHISIQHALLAP